MTSQPPYPAAAADARRAENLALLFQEIFTVLERLRSDRQPVTDAASFRQQIKDALKQAQQESLKRGYTQEDIKLAIFAVVAFLDESVQHLRQPVFRDWPKQLLQEELFGSTIAGEVFFQHLQTLLGRNDSQELADLLEVYQLCMLLGFAGKYSIAGRGDLRAIIASTAEKIQRIRRTTMELSPQWRIPNETIKAPAADPFVKRLIFGSAGCVVLALVLFVVYWLVLRSGVSSLKEFAGVRG